MLYVLIAIRHGHTAYNEDGKEKLRGWLPVPLDNNGMLQSMRTAARLKNLSLDGIKTVHTSDLPRAVQTAQEIASTLGLTVEPHPELKDWNVGKFTGTDVNDSLDGVHHYIDHPNEIVPKGESYKDFYSRAVPFLKKLVESDDMNMAVTHNRVMTLLNALSQNNGKVPNSSALKKKGPVEPGGILIVNPDWSSIAVDEKSKSHV